MIPTSAILSTLFLLIFTELQQRLASSEMNLTLKFTSEMRESFPTLLHLNYCDASAANMSLSAIIFANMTLFPNKAALWGFTHESFILVSHNLMMPKSLLCMSSSLADSGFSERTEEHLQLELQMSCNKGLSASVNVVSAA